VHRDAAPISREGCATIAALRVPFVFYMPGTDRQRKTPPGGPDPAQNARCFESGNLYCGERLKRCDAKEAPVPTLQEPEPKFWKATLMLGSMLWKTGTRDPWQPDLHITTVVRSSSARITRQNQCRDHGLVDVSTDRVIEPEMGPVDHLFAWATERGATASDGIEPAAALHLRINRIP
jgi:hypothetical protein